MVYSTFTEVGFIIIYAPLSDANVTAMIVQSDAWIDKKLGAQSTNDALIERLSALLTARSIKGRQPQSQGAGEFTYAHNPVTEWNREIDEIVRMYQSPLITGSAYQQIDEDDRYTVEP